MTLCRVAAVFFVLAMVAFLAAFPFPLAIFFHWVLILAGFALLARDRAHRAGALTAAAVLLVVLLPAIDAIGISIRGWGAGSAPKEGDLGAVAVMSAFLAGPLTMGIFALLQGKGRLRIVGVASLGLGTLGLLGIVSDLPEGVIGVSLGAGTLLGLIAMGMVLPTLWTGRRTPDPADRADNAVASPLLPAQEEP